MGPLPDSQGCRYILLIGDQISKWYVAVGMPNQEAETIPEALVEKWITRFGWPVNPHSDKGTNFMSELFRDLCRIWVIQRTSRTSFRPEESAMIELTNRTMEESISKCVSEHQHDWKNYLQLVMMAYRSSVHAVEKTRQETYYDYRAYGPTYREGHQVLVFFPKVKEGETKSSHLSTKDLTQLLKLLTTCICHDERKKIIKVQHDRLKQYMCGSKQLSELS